MISSKNITNNPQRYNIGEETFKVSSIADSPNSNKGGEIKPLEFPLGKFQSEDILKPLLKTDSVIVSLSSGEYLCSQKTLDSIKEFQNPHFSILSNGSITIKDKSVTIGKTIPILILDTNGLSISAKKMKNTNSFAGVESVEWLFEGEKEMGVPINLINQIDWTLTDGIDKRGDSFAIWDWKLANPSAYSIAPLNIATAQEDGKFDQKKLDTFLKEINSRLNLLNADFTAIKNTFYKGDTPPSIGVKKFERIVAQTIDEEQTVDSFITDSATAIKEVEQTPKDIAVDAQKEATQQLAKKSAEALKLETDALKTTQKSLNEKISEAGGITSYVQQKGGWDNFVKEIQKGAGGQK